VPTTFQSSIVVSAAQAAASRSPRESPAPAPRFSRRKRSTAGRTKRAKERSSVRFSTFTIALSKQLMRTSKPTPSFHCGSSASRRQRAPTRSRKNSELRAIPAVKSVGASSRQASRIARARSTSRLPQRCQRPSAAAVSISSRSAFSWPRCCSSRKQRSTSAMTSGIGASFARLSSSRSRKRAKRVATSASLFAIAQATS
jgi:hypothetical protein